MSPHFTDTEPEARRFIKLPKMTQLLRSNMGIQIQVPLTPGLTTPWSQEQLVSTNCIPGTIISQLSFETKNSLRCMSLTQCVAVTNEARAPEYDPVSSRPKLSPFGHEFSIRLFVCLFLAKQELQ